MNAMVAAHPSYPFGTRLRVTNLANGQSATSASWIAVRQRTFAPTASIIDVSHRAAEVLGFIQRGRTRVRLEVLAWGSR